MDNELIVENGKMSKCHICGSNDVKIIEEFERRYKEKVHIGTTFKCSFCKMVMFVPVK